MSVVDIPMFNMYIERITELAPQIIPLRELAVTRRKPTRPMRLNDIRH
ncbi:hypothetical protein JCM16161A_23500 [Vulcanisaeta sp. JCM 16161]